MKVKIISRTNIHELEKDFNTFANTVNVLKVLLEPQTRSGYAIYHILYEEKEQNEN